LYSGSSGSVSALAGLTTITNAGSLNVSNGASLSFAEVVGNAGLIAGNGTLTGSINNAGTISPGSSTGTLSITGSVYNTDTAVLLIEIAGSDAGLYDVLSVSGAYEVGGTLVVRFLPGAENLLATDVLTIVHAGSLLQSGEELAFGDVHAEIAGTFDVLYDQPSGLIQLTGFEDIVPIPEPATLVLLGLGALGLLKCQKRHWN
jgi:hypothetical protein